MFGLEVLSDVEQQLRIGFEVGNYVFLEVPHMRIEWRFNMKGKLAPRYVGPFKM